MLRVCIYGMADEFSDERFFWCFRSLENPPIGKTEPQEGE